MTPTVTATGSGTLDGQPITTPGVSIDFEPGSSSPIPWGTPLAPPVVDYTTLYQKGDLARDVLTTRLNAYVAAMKWRRAVVGVPVGWQESVPDFVLPKGSAPGWGYTIFNPVLAGFKGLGRGQAQLIVTPNSMSAANKAANPPAGVGTIQQNILRCGPVTNLTDPTYIEFLDIVGSLQESPDAASTSSLINGLSDYKSLNAIFYGMRVFGCAGNHNSPPGETFLGNSYYSINPMYVDCEFDGRLPGAVAQIGGGVGDNSAVNVQHIRTYIHHTASSGATTASAGGPAGTPTNGLYTEDCIIEAVANISGQLHGDNFALGWNHEGISGDIIHNRETIKGHRTATDMSEHYFFGSANGTPTSIQILGLDIQDDLPFSGTPLGMPVLHIPPTYGGKPNTCFNAPVTVTDKAGNVLTPVVRGKGTPVLGKNYLRWES